MKITVILSIVRITLPLIQKRLKWNHCKLFSRKFITKPSINNFLISNDSFHSRSIQCFSFATKTVPSEEIFQLADILCEQSGTTDPAKRNEVARVLNFLTTFGYSMEEIKEKCNVYLKPHECSLEKIKQISVLDSNVLNLLPFMSLSTTALRRAVQQAREDKLEIKGFINRLSYLSHHLETPIEELIPALAKHLSLITMQFHRLQNKMSILKEADISTVDLVKDLWIFNYNEKLLVNRISLAESAHVKLKPWMLRCNGKFFVSMLNKYSETQRILGDDDIYSYLSKRLDCSEDYVRHMMERNKYLKKINVIKIDQITNFLLEKGYTPQEIRIYPTVFSANLETLKKRLELWSQFRITLPSLSRLCLSAKKFQTIMEKLRKNQQN